MIYLSESFYKFNVEILYHVKENNRWIYFEFQIKAIFNV